MPNAVASLQLLGQYYKAARDAHKESETLNSDNEDATMPIVAVTGSDGHYFTKARDATSPQSRSLPSYNINYTILKGLCVPLLVAFFFLQNDRYGVVTKIVVMLVLLVHFVVIGGVPVFIPSASQSAQ